MNVLTRMSRPMLKVTYFFFYLHVTSEKVGFFQTHRNGFNRYVA